MKTPDLGLIMAGSAPRAASGMLGGFSGPGAMRSVLASLFGARLG